MLDPALLPLLARADGGGQGLCCASRVARRSCLKMFEHRSTCDRMGLTSDFCSGVLELRIEDHTTLSGLTPVPGDRVADPILFIH